MDNKHEKKKENNELESLIQSIILEYSEKKDLSVLENDIRTLPYSLENSLSSLRNLYNFLYTETYSNWEKENEKVKELGGLFVLGTERHETRRIDNQLRGRAGRQGDPGVSQFYVSLEDELIKVFGGDSIKRWVEYLIEDKDTPLEADLLTKSLENAQEKVEIYNYEMRKNVFQYDDILNNQRKQLFRARNEILLKNIFNELFLRYSENLFDDQVEKIKNKKDFYYEIEKSFDSYSFYFLEEKNIEKLTFYKEIWISNDLRLANGNFYQTNFLNNNRGTTLLSIIDFYWTEHLERMSYIRETINWRSYGQQNPLLEYNIEAFKSFNIMFEQIRSCMLYYSLNNSINY
jgi:preprotein translocase subunit SecA